MRAVYQREVDACNEKCAEFERVKAFALADHMFTMDRDELTPYRVYSAILYGVPHTAMPAFESITDERRWQIALYALTFGHSEEDASLIVEADDGVYALTHLWWFPDRTPEIDPYAPDQSVLDFQRKRVLEAADVVIPGHGEAFRTRGAV